MFASLRNKFSNYWTCSLRFDIEGNIIIEDFASLRFDNLVICFDVYTIEACAKPEGVYTTGAWAPSGRVCTAEECTAPGGICHRARDASGRVCTAEVCTAAWGVCHKGPSCIWTCLHYRGVYYSWRCLPQGLSCIWTCLHYRGVYYSWRCLPQGLSCIWTCLHYRGLWCFWRCLHYGGMSCIWTKAVNREDKRSRRYRDQHFAKFERSRRYQDRYRC
jgi:hypothetical protein